VSDERFGRSVVEMLAKRAASICSNPECGILTIGPAGEDDRANVIGEAAHIYGARPGSARFDPAMSVADRGDITNGIWLCCNCHKAADSDPNEYPDELLFEWRRAHEAAVRERLGKPGLLRQKVVERSLEGFEACSYRAQQILIDKPEFWEYKLTAELLRSALDPIRKRWEALDRGLYSLPRTVVPISQAGLWMSVTMEEASGQIDALDGLINGALQASWGAPGVAGDTREILRVSNLIAEACQRLLAWEEKVRFTSIEPPGDEMPSLIMGGCGPNLAKVCEIPAWLTSIFNDETPSGQYEFMLHMDLPDGWADRIHSGMKRARARGY
jgi:hypothetical protein